MKKAWMITIILAILVVAGLVWYFNPSESTSCAKEGEIYSEVFEEYPKECCEGLDGWLSGFDTSISIADECYETMLLAGSPTGTCIKCDDGVCGKEETFCNCPQDCTGKNKSDYNTIAEFCSSKRWVNEISGVNYGLKRSCAEDELMANLSICKLC